MTSATAPRDSDVYGVIDGSATIYRLYDVGYEIDLARAAQLLTPHTPPRARPRRGEAAALVTPKPPLTLSLGSKSVAAAGATTVASLSAAVFGFGVISLRVAVSALPDSAWSDYVRFGGSLHGESAWPASTRRRSRYSGAAPGRRGIDRKLEITRDTYSMLNAESQATRGEVMEFAILLLILGEILLSLFGRR